MVIKNKLIPDQIELTEETPEPASSLVDYVKMMSGWHQLSLCFMAMIISLINLIPIELQRRIIDTAIESQDLEALVLFGTIYAVVLIVHQITKFIFRMYQGWVAESAVKNTRRRLISVYAESDKNEEGNDGSTVSVIGSEVEAIGTFVGENISDASANVMMLLSVSGYMIYVEPQIAVFALIFFIPQIALTPFMQRLLNKLIEKRVNLIRELGDAIPDMKDIEEEPAVIRKIYFNRMKFFLVKYGMKTVINFLNTLGPLTVLLYGGYLAVQGETTAGVIVAFLSGFDRMAGPVSGLIGFYRIAAQIKVQHKMMAKWMKVRL